MINKYDKSTKSDSFTAQCIKEAIYFIFPKIKHFILTCTFFKSSVIVQMQQLFHLRGEKDIYFFIRVPII